MSQLDANIIFDHAPEASDTDSLIAEIHGRLARCRRLLETITDQQTVTVLRQMVTEGENDISRLGSKKLRTIN